MLKATSALTLAFALCLAQVAGAQTTTPTPTPAPAPDATTAPAAPAAGADATTPAEPPAAPAVGDNGVGSAYDKATSGDWTVRCIRTADGKDPCQLYQLLKDDKGNSVAEFSMVGLPAGQQVAAGATIVTPLETLLSQQITLQIDAAAPKLYPFTFCAPRGCIARVGFAADEIAAMKKGTAIKMTLVPVAAPDQTVALTISLKGFTAGFDQVNKLNGN